MDFTAFPRQYAKSRTYGTSALCASKSYEPCCAAPPARALTGNARTAGVMDTGVGCALFASALVAKQARHGAGGAAIADPCAGLRPAAPLLVLGTCLCCKKRPVHSSRRPAGWRYCQAACAGGARAVATWATGYEVDATEYGEHWNFYLTLGAVSLLSAIARIPPRLLLPVGRLPSQFSRAAPVTQGLRSWVGKLVS